MSISVKTEYCAGDRRIITGVAFKRSVSGIIRIYEDIALDVSVPGRQEIMHYLECITADGTDNNFLFGIIIRKLIYEVRLRTALIRFYDHIIKTCSHKAVAERDLRDSTSVGIYDKCLINFVAARKRNPVEDKKRYRHEERHSQSDPCSLGNA